MFQHLSFRCLLIALLPRRWCQEFTASASVEPDFCRHDSIHHNSLGKATSRMAIGSLSRDTEAITILYHLNTTRSWQETIRISFSGILLIYEIPFCNIACCYSIFRDFAILGFMDGQVSLPSCKIFTAEKGGRICKPPKHISWFETRTIKKTQRSNIQNMFSQEIISKDGNIEASPSAGHLHHFNTKKSLQWTSSNPCSKSSRIL